MEVYTEVEQKFGGRWKIYKSENFEAFLQEVGMYRSYEVVHLFPSCCYAQNYVIVSVILLLNHAYTCR